MREEFLNIWIHEDEQLEALLDGIIITRENLSHWPLSYVEKIMLKDNTQFVYKSQHSASSMEKKVYSKIQMPFLISPIYYETYKNCDIMIFPYLNYPTLGDVCENELEQVISSISCMIQNISDMPVFFDVSSVGKLEQIINEVCIIFEEKDEAQNTTVLKNWVSEKAYTCFLNQQIGNVHGDLTASNILTKNGKPQYILDWQRPMKAPVLLENALAFRLAGYDGVKKYGDFGLLAVVCHFIWYSYACNKFMPFIYETANKLLLEFTLMLR